MKYGVLVIILLPLFLFACSSNPTSSSLFPHVKGSLVLQVSDSYHVSDTTSNWAATINYRLVENQTLEDSGSIVISTGGQLGNIYTVKVDSLPSGGITAIFTVPRPFVIIGRKDNIGKARFADTVQVTVPQFYTALVPVEDIWAFHPDQLFVYFDGGIGNAYADSLMQNFGLDVISRHQTFLDSTLFYLVSTENAGDEADIKPLVAAAPGVRDVFFNVFGHSYF